MPLATCEAYLKSIIQSIQKLLISKSTDKTTLIPYNLIGGQLKYPHSHEKSILSKIAEDFP